jgi:hypothetical protein
MFFSFERDSFELKNRNAANAPNSSEIKTMMISIKLALT